VSDCLFIQRTPEETRVGLRRGGRLWELEVDHTGGRSLSGNVYRGRVVRISAEMNAAFVEIGLEKQGLLHAQDVWLSTQHHSRPETLQSGVDGAPPSRGSAPKIDSIIEIGQEVLVQITREPIAKKGPRVTMFPSLPGRNVVLLPHEPHVGVSRMIDDPDERQRLHSLVHRILPRELGAIVRTVGEAATEAEVANDLAFLRAQWFDLKERFAHASAPSFLHADLDLTLRSLRDRVTAQTETIWITDPSDRDRVETFLKRFHPDLSPQVREHSDNTSLFMTHGLSTEVDASLNPQVTLPEGGDLMIELTEAMTVIDVNSSRRKESGRLADSQLRLNLSAAREIARQLQLRNIGGLVVVDFVKMRRVEDRRMLEAVLEAELSQDRARVRISRMNRFGIVMMTRKRARQSIYGPLTDSCAVCQGRGYVRSATDIAVETLNRLRKTLRSAHSTDLLLRVEAPARVAAVLQGQLAGVIDDLAERHGAEIVISALGASAKDSNEVALSSRPGGSAH